MSPILTRMIGAGSAGSGFGFGRRRGGGGPSSLIIQVKLWGAGGNGGQAGSWSYGAAAGGGGFVNATFSLPIIYQGTNLILQVGNQGFGVGTAFQRGFGGGCTADNGPNSDNRYGGGGGGYTGIFLASVSQGNALAIAGGGGGGGSSRAGEGNVGGAGGSTDPQWPGSVGTGGLANNGAGQSGFARITYNGVETTYSYTGSNVTITL